MTIAHTRPVSPISNSGRPFGEKKKYIYGKLSVTHNLPEDVKSLPQKICGFFATEMA